MITPQIALSRSFLDALARLPKAEQKKVREFTEKFRHDPTQPGINFEHLAGVRDDKVRSVRIGQAYRAILIHPPRGDVYLLVWVDHHDEAYQWVRNRRFEVNPAIGSFQVYQETDAVETEPLEDAAAPVPAPARGARKTAKPPKPAKPPPARPAPFDHLTDEDLIFAGVPGPLLAAVRAVASDEDLDGLSAFLPEDASDMLHSLAAGYTLLEAIEQLDRKPVLAAAAVDVEDFSTALAHPESQRSFKIVESEGDLDAMLDAPLEQWRIFLHPTQRKVVTMQAQGPIRVLGGPGTGKTVALMHRANHLATNVFNGPDDRLLVTTFTKNLAGELDDHLKRLCGRDVHRRLEVTNLHAWAIRFMRAQGIRFVTASEQDRNRLMESALAEAGSGGHSPTFCMEEWNRVVQAGDATSRDAYLTASRQGRGARLGRVQRVGLWKVFERYRELLVLEGQVEWPDVIRETRLFIEKNAVALPYRAVLADEVQDFTAGDLRLLRALVPAGPCDLFLVGDAHQRIYGHQARLGHCGIEIRGRSRRLRVNYRTTAEISRQSLSLLQGRSIDDLDGGRDDLDGYHSLRQGPAPEILHFSREADEAQAILDHIRSWLAFLPPAFICVAARTGDLLRSRYRPLLESAGIPTFTIEKDPESQASHDGVRLATMHRMKGLEFPAVLLAAVHDGVVPYPAPVHARTDDDLLATHELQERCLLYVAMTRARDRLCITGFGKRTPFLPRQAPGTGKTTGKASKT